MKRFLIALAALAAVSCGTSPDAPGAVDLAGTWIGTATATGSPAGVGAVRATLTQDSAGALRGTWGSTYANAIYNNGGGLSGQTIGSSVQMSLSSGVAFACGYELSGTITRPSVTIAGTFAAVNCSVGQSGSFSLTKQ